MSADADPKPSVPMSDSPSPPHPNQLQGIGRLVSRWSIRNKISSGYGLALGVAILGTIAGLTVGNYYETRARERAEIVQEEGIVLSDLQVNVWQVRSHQQRLITTIDRPEQFEQQYDRYREHLNRTQALIAQVRAIPEDEAIAIAGFQTWLHAYQDTVSLYDRTLSASLVRLNPQQLSPEQRDLAQQVLIDFSNSQIAREFDRLSHDLSDIVTRAWIAEEGAKADLERAAVLRMQIIMASMVLSVALAILLAFSISRAISHPLQELTRVAQTVTRESNFNLQAAVVPADEVGQLATSLNQLIAQVKHLLAEQEAAARAQLVQHEKMSSLGRSIAGVAHEINNPVNFISGNLSHARDYVEDLLAMLQTYADAIPDPPSAVRRKAEDLELDFVREDVRQVFDAMSFGAERIQHIVASLKDFSRLDEAEATPVDVRDCLESTLTILQNRFKRGPLLQRDYSDIPPVRGYTGLLYQVFMNLIANALDALESEGGNDGRSPQITISTERLDETFVQVRIADNGSGIAPEHQAKIFDTFFTTKPRGVGTGLGLAIARQIVEDKHRGKITCTSTPGRGTEFAIALPIYEAAGGFESPGGED